VDLHNRGMLEDLLDWFYFVRITLQDCVYQYGSDGIHKFSISPVTFSHRYDSNVFAVCNTGPVGYATVPKVQFRADFALEVPRRYARVQVVDAFASDRLIILCGHVTRSCRNQGKSVISRVFKCPFLAILNQGFSLGSIPNVPNI